MLFILDQVSPKSGQEKEYSQNNIRWFEKRYGDYGIQDANQEETDGVHCIKTGRHTSITTQKVMLLLG